MKNNISEVKKSSKTSLIRDAMYGIAVSSGVGLLVAMILMLVAFSLAH